MFIAEQEASWLRAYIDEPSFTDLHWVTSVPGRNGIFFVILFFFCFYTEEHYNVYNYPGILITKSVSCFLKI